MKRACKTCGAPASGAYCHRHRQAPVANPTSWNGRRDKTAQARFARAVKNRDGYQCVVCGSTMSLQAHHVRPGFDVSDGVTLCRVHHRAVDRNAR